MMTYKEFETACHPQDGGTWAVFIRCVGYPASRAGCLDGLHEPHDILHSRGLNADHAAIVAKNWGGKAVDES